MRGVVATCRQCVVTILANDAREIPEAWNTRPREIQIRAEAFREAARMLHDSKIDDDPLAMLMDRAAEIEAGK